MATRYVTVRARLTDQELAVLRAQPGANDSERLREAIARAGRETRLVSLVGNFLLDRITERLSAAVEGASDQLAAKIVASLKRAVAEEDNHA